MTSDFFPRISKVGTLIRRVIFSKLSLFCFGFLLAVIFNARFPQFAVQDTSHKIPQNTAQNPAQEVASPTSTSDIINIDNISGAQIDERKIEQIIHVDRNKSNASNDNSGSEAEPLKTIGAAVEQATEYLKQGKGTKILIHPGTYREGEIEIDGRSLGERAADVPFVIEGTEKGQIILSGSERWEPDTWQPVRDSQDKITHYVHDWEYDFGNRGGAWGKYGPESVISHRSEMVFLNGEPLKQILLENYDYTRPDERRGRGEHKYSGFSEPESVLTPGSFGVAERAENGNKIYLKPEDSANFSESQIEVSTQRFLLRFFYMHNVVLRNITFQHSAGEIEVDAAVLFGPWFGEDELRNHNVLIEDCNFLWNNSRGLSLLHSEDVTLRRSAFNYNGFMGIQATVLLNTIWENNETNFNNWRGYRSGFVGWAIGGAKLHFTRDGIFRQHQSIGNKTRGLWFDNDNSNILVEDLVGIHNIRNLFLEISQGPIEIRRALLADDEEVNFLISNATNIALKDSIIYGGDAGGDAIQFTSANSRSFQEYVSRVLGDSNGEDVPILLEETQFLNNVIAVSDESQALIVQKNGEPNVYKDFLETGYSGSGNTYWAPDEDVFGVGFQREVMVDLDQWQDLTSETSAQWIDPEFANPSQYDFRFNRGSALRDHSANLPTQTVDSEKIQELEEYLQFVEYLRE